MPERGGDRTQELVESVCAAVDRRTPLTIAGGGSKSFYGRPPADGEPLDVTPHAGVVAYEPTELVLTARAGTRLAEIESLLMTHGQMLPFEPPHFGPGATLGGAVACGLSGPRRPFTGTVRDAVLGVKLINGYGQLLNMGGQVMKNVAGFDVSRLMVGALGTLGVLLEVTVKVLPRPEVERTLVQVCDQPAAIRRMSSAMGACWPLSGLAHADGKLYLRLAGAERAVAAAARRWGGETVPDADDFWPKLRELSLPFFAGDGPLWRLSLPPACDLAMTGQDGVVDWGGAVRWLKCPAGQDEFFMEAARRGGHASLFKGGGPADRRFQPLAPALLELHQRLKRAFDPLAIFNRGRMYPEF